MESTSSPRNENVKESAPPGQEDTSQEDQESCAASPEDQEKASALSKTTDEDVKNI